MTKPIPLEGRAPMNRAEFEKALDERRLWLKESWMNGPRWYLVRRNGRTHTWKTDATRWEIPIKWKYNNCMRIGDWNFDMLSKSLKVNPGQQ